MESRGPEDSKNVKTSQAYFFEGFISFFEDFSLTNDVLRRHDYFSLMMVPLHYPIYTCTLAMAERGSANTGRALPSPNWSTSQRLSRRGSRRGSSVNTQPRRASLFVHMCYMYVN